jgi:hypothetical protein
MRSLTSSLQAAQRSLLVKPAVSCVRSRVSAGEARFVLQPTVPSGGAGGPVGVCAGGGSLHLFYLAGGSLKYDRYTGCPAVPAQSAQTVAACSDNLVSAAQGVGTAAAALAVVTTTSGTQTANLYLNPTGASWNAVESVPIPIASSLLVRQIACAFAPDGRLFVVDLGQTQLCVLVRSTGGVWTSYTASDVYRNDGSLDTGVACAYTVPSSTRDLAIFLSASWQPIFSELACVLFGDGGVAAAGSFSTHVTVTATQPYNVGAHQAGTWLTVGGLALADTLRGTFLEEYQNPDAGVATRQHAALSCLQGANWSAGYTREPQALPSTGAGCVKPAYDRSTGVLYLANASVIYAGTQPVAQDLSGRVLKVIRNESESHGKASVLLDNSDLAITSLANDVNVMGDRLDLAFGYTTSAGMEVSQPRPLWVSAAHATDQPGRGTTVELLARDAWALLADWRPKRFYAFVPGTLAIWQMVQWILAKVGIDFAVPGSPSTLAQAQPGFAIPTSTTGLHAVHELLDMVPEVLTFTPAGGQLINPQVGDAAVYAYSPSTHQPLVAHIASYPPGVNHVLVFGKATGTALAPSLLAEAIDTADTQRIGDVAHIVRDMQLAAGNASARAAVPLRKAQLLTDIGEIAALPNVGLEVWDPISVTYPRLGLNNTVLRARTIITRYEADVDGGIYTQSVGLMAR